MTTDAYSFAPARALPAPPSVIFGIVAFAFSIALLAIVITTPDADGADDPAFSPVAISFTRFLNMRTSELSSVYLETASARDERPIPPPAPVIAPAPTNVRTQSQSIV